MKNLLALVFSLSISFYGTAQTSGQDNYTDITQFKDSTLLTDCLTFLDSNNTKTPDQVLNETWRPLSDYHIKKFIPASWIGRTVYLKLNLSNNSDSTESIFFFPGISFSSINLFVLSDNNRPEKINDLSRLDGYQPLTLNAKEKHTFIVRLKFTKTPFNRLIPQLIKKNFIEKFQKNLYYTNYALLLIGYLFSGIILMMTVFSAANYMLSRKKEFLYNSLYASSVFLLVFFNTFIDKRSGIPVSIFIGYGAFSLLAVGTVFYIAFTRKFLDTRINYPSLNKLFLYSEKLFIFLWLCFTYFHFFTENYALQQLVENTMKLCALVLGVVYIIIAVVQKNRFMNYLALGNGILILLSAVSLYILLFPG